MIKREKIELTFGRKNRETIEIPNSAIDYLSIANVRLTKKFKNRSCTKFERIKICESSVKFSDSWKHVAVHSSKS